MRGNELFDIMEYIDPGLIESADCKPRIPWKRWAMRAACLALALALCVNLIVAIIPRNSIKGNVSMFNSLLNPSQLTGVQILGDRVDMTPALAGCANPYYEFHTLLAVEARVLELLPDTYYDYVSREHYRILKFEVLDAINGEGIPDQLYMRLNTYKSPELDRFDSMILSLEQKGIENYQLYNQEKGTIDVFPHMFEIYHDSSAVAFTEGIVDLSLWDMDGWYVNSEALTKMQAGEYSDKFPATAGSSVAYTKKRILAEVRDSAELQKLKVVDASDFHSSAQEILAKVTSYDEGTFAHEVSCDEDYKTGKYSYYIHCIRTINGFTTTEEYNIGQTGIFVWTSPSGNNLDNTDTLFTRSDLVSIVDLGALIETLDIDDFRMPNVFPLTPVEITRSGITGKYIKRDGMVYGVVKVSWQFRVKGKKGSYYDALFLLVEPDGSYRTVSREKVEEMVFSTVDELIRDVEYGIR